MRTVPGDVLLKGLLLVEAASPLIEVGKLGVLSDDDAATRRFEVSHDPAKKCGLPRAVGADDADAFPSLQHEAQGAHELAPTESEAQVVRFEDRAAKPLFLQFEACDLLRARSLRVAQRDGSIHARLRLRGAGLGRASKPFEFRAQEVLPVGFCTGRVRQAFRFGGEIRLPPAGVAVNLTLVDLDGAGDDPVEHVAIMRDQEKRPRILFFEIGFEPFDRVGIEVVGRLI